ncbi:MAG: metal-dependent transcriptional regulator [Acidobacteria bacterium]|nr:metal-dependent transcriptional regulator [Acidobacteriota bacterium]
MKVPTTTRTRQVSVSEQDYLKAICHMQLELQAPISARLSEALGVTPPAVTAALRRMARRGHVRLDSKGGRIRLTAKGRAIGQRLVLRHRLIERLLTDVLGMDWKVVHDEAEKLEHAISPEIERRLLNRFGRDSSCPHGDPFIGGLAKLRRQGVIALSEARPGSRVKVVRVDEHAREFLIFLEELGLIPGVEFRVLGKSYDATMSIEVGQRQHHLGKSSTDRVWILPARISG